MADKAIASLFRQRSILYICCYEKNFEIITNRYRIDTHPSGIGTGELALARQFTYGYALFSC